MSSTNKKLPNGVWLFVAGVPLGTTDEAFYAYLKTNFLDIGPECIDLRDYKKTACGVIAVQDAVVHNLVCWALENTNTTFNGVGLDVRLATRRSKYQSRIA